VQYQGGKSRLAKFFAPFIEAALAETGGFLYEPFTGGFNIQPALRPGLVRRALNGDAHLGLVTMYQALKQGWDPPAELSREEWHAVKDRSDWSDPLTAFAAFGCSFRAYEFGGYSSGPGASSATRARNGLLRKLAFMGPVEFRWQDFAGGTLDCELEGRATIYADPPYAQTAGYLKEGGGFNHQRFYRWIGRMADSGHIVLLSEFTPPEGVDYDVIWQKPRYVSGTEAGSKRIEEVYRVWRTKQ
jgi:DNA adenine methylase